MKNNNKAFTMVEVLIVVGVIALLSTIAIPHLLRSRVSANDASAQAALKTIANALENHAIINNVYPTNPNDLLVAIPPYLNTDYFATPHNGFSYTHTITDYTYSIVATPTSANSGTQTFTITTGAVFQ